MNDKCCSLPPESLSPAPSSAAVDYDRLAGWSKALGHPARLRILAYLMARDTCVCGAIVDQLDLAQSTVSQHLKVLKEAGIVQGTIDGPRVCYCVDRAVLAAITTNLQIFFTETP
ncbi:MAG: ArsR/SmtB family transcription factor [Planctomycetota bacterium]|jgi:ArsR family transcriptional regulator